MERHLISQATAGIFGPRIRALFFDCAVNLMDAHGTAALPDSTLQSATSRRVSFALESAHNFGRLVFQVPAAVA
jgi:hypothetical protein